MHNDSCVTRNRPRRLLALFPLLTSSRLAKIGIFYAQPLQEEKIFPMIPRSESSAQWSLNYAQKCYEMWVDNSEQNSQPLHVTSYSMPKIARLDDAFSEVF